MIDKIKKIRIKIISTKWIEGYRQTTGGCCVEVDFEY